MTAQSEEHGSHSIGRKLVWSYDGSPDVELEITECCEEGGKLTGWYIATEPDGKSCRVAPGDFREGRVRWVRGPSDEHGPHNVGRRLIGSYDGHPDTELEITDWVVDWLVAGSGHYEAKTAAGMQISVLYSDFSDGKARWLREHSGDCDGNPCECGLVHLPKLPVWGAFQRALEQGRESPQYAETTWMELQRKILALIYLRSPAPTVEIMKLPVWAPFHTGWGQAKASPQYDKEVWKQFEYELLTLIRRDSEPEAPAEARGMQIPTPHQLKFLSALLAMDEETTKVASDDILDDEEEKERDNLTVALHKQGWLIYTPGATPEDLGTVKLTEQALSNEDAIHAIVNAFR